MAAKALMGDGWGEILRGGDLAIGGTLKESGQAAIANRSGAERTAAARLLLLERKLNRARAAAYKLGCETIDKARPKAELLRDVEPIRAELVAIRAGIDASADATRERLERARREALLDLEYVEEEKAMSPRLGHYLDSRRR